MGRNFLDFMKNLGIFILCAQSLMHFTAGKAYEKYVKLLIGIMILAQFTVQVRAVFLGTENAGIWEQIERFQQELEDVMQETGRDMAVSFGKGVGGKAPGGENGSGGTESKGGVEGVTGEAGGGAGIWGTEKSALEAEIKERLAGAAASCGVAVEEVEIKGEPPKIAVAVSRENAEGRETEGQIKIEKITIGDSRDENGTEDVHGLAEAFAKALGTYADYIEVTVISSAAGYGARNNSGFLQGRKQTQGKEGIPGWPAACGSACRNKTAELEVKYGSRKT